MLSADCKDLERALFAVMVVYNVANGSFHLGFFSRIPTRMESGMTFRLCKCWPLFILAGQGF